MESRINAVTSASRFQMICHWWITSWTPPISSKLIGSSDYQIIWLIRANYAFQSIELCDVNLKLLGDHQRQNAVTASCTALCLRNLGNDTIKTICWQSIHPVASKRNYFSLNATSTVWLFVRVSVYLFYHKHWLIYYSYNLMDLGSQGWDISDASIQAGLEETQLPGRSQILTQEEALLLGLHGATVLIDGGLSSVLYTIMYPQWIFSCVFCHPLMFRASSSPYRGISKDLVKHDRDCQTGRSSSSCCRNG